MSYDETNIFAHILRGDIPCTKILEDEHCLAFADINPAAPVHVLVIPKGNYIDWSDFAQNATDQEQAAFTRMIHKVAETTGILETGYRVVSNIGQNGHQEVPHLHAHVLGGAPIGPMVSSR